MNKIDINTKESFTNKNKFISTLNSKQNGLANPGNTNKFRVTMLTSLSMKKETSNAQNNNNNYNPKIKTNTLSTYRKNQFLNNNKNETLSDAKNKKKFPFYKSHNKITMKNTSGSLNNNNNNNYINIHQSTDNNIKVMNSSLIKNSNSSGNFYNLKNSPTANFKSSPSNKKSLEIADLSIIKPSSEIELRMNLMHKKNSLNQSPNGNYMERIRKIRSLDNKSVDKRELIFNKIYSFNNEFNKMLKTEQVKNFDSLYDYQNHIVKFIADKTSMDNLRNLSLKLKNVREINESYNTVNKVNWKLFAKIIHNCNDEMKSIRERSYGGESEAIKNTEKFKKELGLQNKKQISFIKKFSKYESSLKRISPYIPEFLVEKFTKSLKIIN